MKKSYIIYACLCLIGCGNSATVESFNEAGEKIVIAENEKAELALVDIGKMCAEKGYTVVNRGGSLIIKDGTRIVAKCGKEPIKKEEKSSNWFSFNK